MQVADIDFFSDPFPAADVITMGMILHDWGPQKKQLLIQKVQPCCYHALVCLRLFLVRFCMVQTACVWRQQLSAGRDHHHPQHAQACLKPLVSCTCMCCSCMLLLCSPVALPVVQAFDALPPGCAFIALDLIIDDSRNSNVWGLLMSLNMLLEFEEENAADYTLQVRPRRFVCCMQLYIDHVEH